MRIFLSYFCSWGEINAAGVKKEGQGVREGGM